MPPTALCFITIQSPAQSGLSSPAHIAGICCYCISVKHLQYFSWPSVIQSDGVRIRLAQPDTVTSWADWFIAGGMADESCKLEGLVVSLLGKCSCCALLCLVGQWQAWPQLEGECPQCFGALPTGIPLMHTSGPGAFLLPLVWLSG